MNLERGMSRVGIGCGSAAAFVLATLVITVGGVVLRGFVPGHVGGRGEGQGEGILAGMLIIASPVIGLVAAWKPRLGAALATVILLALVALHVAAAAGM